MPVAEGELGERLLPHPLGRLEVRGSRLHPERDLGGPAGGLAPFALDQAVDGLLRHPPLGGQLAAGDRQHPRRGLIKLLFARDVDRLARVAGRDQRSHPGVGADQVARPSEIPKKAFDRVEQVLDSSSRPGGGGGCRRRSRCRWCRSACGRTRAARRSSALRRPGRCRRRGPSAGRRASRIRWVPRLGAIRGTSSSSTTSSGRIAVGPDAGRVDDVVGLDLDPLARVGLDEGDAGGAAAAASDLDHLGAVQHHRAVALGLAQNGQHEADVVGLAVVEEVGVLGRARRAPGPSPAPRRGRSCGGGRGTSQSPRPPRLHDLVLATAATGPGRRHHVVHVEADARPCGRDAPRPGRGRGTGSGRRGAAPAGPSAGAPAAPRGPVRGRSSAGSAGRRGPSSRSGWRCRWRSRRAPAGRPSSRARRRRGRPRRR